MPPIPFTPSKDQRLKAVQDIVYEYANLVSAGHFSLTGSAPWRTHCDDAFLLGCRKMDDFLMRKTRSNYARKKEADDILAIDYLPDDLKITWELPIWAKEWREPMNKQLAHLSYNRDKEWDHTIWVPQLIPEFKHAWGAFLDSILDPEYRAAFAEHLRLKRHIITQS